VKQNASIDSSFWINAHRAGLLPHVLDRYALRYAPAVAAEVKASFPSGREFWSRVGTSDLREASPEKESFQEFGPGERGAIQLALEHRDWLLLLDDQRPFVAATSMGLKVICTPVFAVALHQAGAFDARQTLTVLARLAAMQTVSPHLVAAALAHLGAQEKARG
jgi:predicted nucleic acid-binding protein